MGFRFLLRKNTAKYSVSILAVFFLFFSFHDFAYALFRKSKIQKTSPPVDVSENPPYRIFFNLEPAFGSGDSKKRNWIDLNYKLVNETDNRGTLFAGAAGGKVRFLDKDGFVVASDFFLNEDFQKTDFYSSLPVEQKRADSIVSADAVALRDGELELLQRERFEKAERKAKEEKLFLMAVHQGIESSKSVTLLPPLEKAQGRVQTINPVFLEKDASAIPAPEADLVNLKNSAAPASVPVPAVLIEPQAAMPSEVKPEPMVKDSDASAELDHNETVEIPAEPIKAVSEIFREKAEKGSDLSPAKEQKEVTAVTPQAKMSMPPEKNKELLAIGGDTNEDIQQKLLAQNEKPETVVSPSPSSIPEISSEDPSSDTSVK